MTNYTKCRLTYKQYCFLLNRLQAVTKNGYNEGMMNAVLKSYFEVSDT